MSGKLRPHLSLVAVLAALALTAGCITVPKAETGQSDPPRPQTPETEDPAPIEERWSCGNTMLTAICWSGGDCYGEVKTGKFSAKITSFRINGVDRRWNWCLKDGAYDCSFVITPSGWGRYYDFRGSRGKKIKPSGVFKCTET